MPAVVLQSPGPHPNSAATIGLRAATGCCSGVRCPSQPHIDPVPAPSPTAQLKLRPWRPPFHAKVVSTNSDVWFSLWILDQFFFSSLDTLPSPSIYGLYPHIVSQTSQTTTISRDTVWAQNKLGCERESERHRSTLRTGIGQKLLPAPPTTNYALHQDNITRH